MKITIKNYEAYLLDLIEENISLVDKAELYDFFNKNPEINIDISEFENVKLNSENIKFEKKKLLKKNKAIHIENISEIDRLSIAFLENDINNNEVDSLEKLLKKQQEKQFNFNIIQQTKLKIDKNVVFKNKKSLKKKTKIYKYIYKTVYAVAAILILFIGFKFVFNQTITIKNNTKKIASINNNFKIRKLKTTKDIKPIHRNLKNNIIPKIIEKNGNKDVEGIINTNKNEVVIPRYSSIIIEKIDIINNIKTDTFIYQQNIIDIENTISYQINDDYDDYQINERKISKMIKQTFRKINIDNYKKKFFASVIIKFKKYIKTKFHIKQTVTEDDRIIIAFKAGNYKYYINRPNSKKR